MKVKNKRKKQRNFFLLVEKKSDIEVRVDELGMNKVLFAYFWKFAINMGLFG